MIDNLRPNVDGRHVTRRDRLEGWLKIISGRIPYAVKYRWHILVQT